MRILKYFLYLFVLGLLFAGLSLLWLNKFYYSPVGFSGTKVFIVEKGRGINRIAEEMNNEGIIFYPKVFSLIAKYEKKTNPKFGEYAFNPQMTPEEILSMLENGQTIIRKIIVPEGKTVLEIYDILKNSERLKLIAIDSDLPSEGSLLPSTYYYHYGDTDLDIFSQMQIGMRAVLDELWEKRAPNLPIQSKEEALILASLIEKETSAPAERPLVASVFINRLNKGMKLEADPTAIYGITKGLALGRKPTAADIKSKNPYNTYKIEGLPPTPICNPGIAAIEAVLNPPQTNYLFFVANGEGGHNFAATYPEHVMNIQKLRDRLKTTAN